MDFADSALCCLIAQAEMPVRHNMMTWMINALGPIYGLAIPLAGLAVFVGSCLVVALSKRPAVIASFLVFLPLPVLIGVFGSVQGVISAFATVSGGGAEVPGDIVAACFATALFTTFLGLIVSGPSYLVLAFGLFFRTLASRAGGPSALDN